MKLYLSINVVIYVYNFLAITVRAAEGKAPPPIKEVADCARLNVPG